MFFIKDTYAKIWSIKPSERYTDIRISTSEKDNREDGKYINSNWFARCVGKAHNQIAKMEEGDRAKIVSGKVSNEVYEKDGEKKSALKVIVFDLERINNSNNNESKPKEKAKKSVSPADFVEIEDGDDLPF